jgi:putative membrane protein
MAEDKTQLAEDRTDLAEDRTVLANERTYGGWMRTGFAAVALGVGFNALFERMEPAWIPKGIATTFLLIAIFIFVSAERRSVKIMERLHTHKVTTFGLGNLRILSIGAIAATLALVAALWLVKMKSGGGG